MKKLLALCSLCFLSACGVLPIQSWENIGTDANGGVYSVDRSSRQRTATGGAIITSRAHFNQTVIPDDISVPMHTDIISTWRFDCQKHQYVLQRTVFYKNQQIVRQASETWAEQTLRDIPSNQSIIKHIEQSACVRL